MTSNLIKNTLLRVIFSTLFLVFGYPDEALPLVFDILLLPLSVQASNTAELVPQNCTDTECLFSVYFSIVFTCNPGRNITCT